MTVPAAPRPKGARNVAIPLAYIAAALAMVVVLLPSALRPPPDPANQSAALSPDAPPDDQSEQLIQSVRQAAGGGAGASEGEGPGFGGPPTTLAPASGECLGNPPRQNFSVYSNKCAPAYHGNNGGSTYKNVFPNEVRIGWYHGFGGPGVGRLPDQDNGHENTQRHTFRVFQTWLNEHFQLWGRKIHFYGIESSDSVEEDQARVQTAVNEYKLFTASHGWLDFCSEFARHGLPMFCVSAPQETFAAADGFVFSYPNVITQAQIAGAEFVCKTLDGKPPKFAGAGVDKSKLRKFANVANYNPRTGAPKKPFDDAFKAKCGRPVDDSFEFGNESGSEADAELAVRKMVAEGITTIATSVEGIYLTYMMTAADALNWHPEWLLLANWGNDTNTGAKVQPATQMRTTFAITGWEMPLRPDQTECYRAYHEVDPSTEPAPLFCFYWQQLVLMAAGIQGAGPNLNADTFRKGLYDLGYKCGISVWMSCGGFSPNDPAFMDDFGVIWWDPSAIAPDDGAAGAYRWVAGGDRYRIGEFPGDDSELFKSGVLTPP